MDNVTQRLEKLQQQFKKGTDHYLGYPLNLDYDYKELAPFIGYTLNNYGDPFVQGDYLLNSFELEREVIHFFCNLTRISNDDAWGYVTHCGSEGNFYGLYVGRELHSDSIVYFSEDAHHSVINSVRLLNMKYAIVQSLPNGEMENKKLKII